MVDASAVLIIQARMRPIDIISVVTYVVDGESLVPVMAARDAFIGRHRAASTLIIVPRLARPEWKVEIAIIAATSSTYRWSPVRSPSR